MAKKLSNNDKLAINNGLSANKTIAQLSKELDVKESLIQDYLDNMFSTLAKVEADRKEAGKKAQMKPKAGDLFINKTSEKKSGGVAIMTREASEHGDAHRESANKVPLKHAGAIGVINPDKK